MPKQWYITSNRIGSDEKTIFDKNKLNLRTNTYSLFSFFSSIFQYTSNFEFSETAVRGAKVMSSYGLDSATRIANEQTYQNI